MSLSATGHDAEAIAEFAPLLKADPDDFDTMRELTRVYIKTGESRKALPLCRKARALDPLDPSVAFNEAWVLQTLDETAALKAYRELIAVNPQYSVAYDALDVILRRRNDPQALVTAWRNIVAEHPGVAMPYLCLGRALASQQDLDGAVEAYRQGINLDGKSGQLQAALGQLLVRKRSFHEAIGPLRTALTLGPIPPDAHIDLVTALYEIKEYAAAHEEAETCRKSGFILPADLVEKLDKAR
jgi:tetratricopeptide (TPR) repeat protein